MGDTPRPTDPINIIAIAEPKLNTPSFFSDILGAYQTTTTLPTDVPTNVSNQIRLYTDSLTVSTVRRLYFYSTSLKAWFYVALS